MFDNFLRKRRVGDHENSAWKLDTFECRNKECEAPSASISASILGHRKEGYFQYWRVSKERIITRVLKHFPKPNLYKMIVLCPQRCCYIWRDFILMKLCSFEGFGWVIKVHNPINRDPVYFLKRSCAFPAERLPSLRCIRYGHRVHDTERLFPRYLVLPCFFKKNYRSRRSAAVLLLVRLRFHARDS